MRLRIAIAIVFTVIAYLAIAVTRRQLFLFHDGIAQFLPDETIAYAHVNLTPTVRRQIELQISNFFPQDEALPTGESLAGALLSALRSPDVREIGLVWLPDSTRSFGGQSAEAMSPRITLLIGQRVSARSDVLAPASFTIMGKELRLVVVRTREGTSLHRFPVQIVVRPRALPVPALEASADRLPATIHAEGFVNRRGFVLRSDNRRVRSYRRFRPPLFVSPRLGLVQVLNFPIRAFLAEISAPTNPELLAALTTALPDTADVVVSADGLALRFPSADFSSERTRAAIRTLVARIWPAMRTSTLDDVSAATLVAEPSSVAIEAIRARWEVRVRGETVAIVENLGDWSVLTTSETLRGAVASGAGIDLRLPAGCASRSPRESETTVILSLHPQFVVSLAFNPREPQYAICGVTLVRLTKLAQ